MEKPRFYRQETTGIRYRIGDLYGYPDSLIRARTSAAYRHAVDVLLERSQPDTVVDFGSGRGHGILAIQELYPKRIISIDKYEPYLSLAQKRGLPNEDKEGVEFAVANSLPLADASIEMIFFMHTIEHVKNPLELLQDMHRVLRPKGDLVVATPDQKNLVGHSPYDEQVFDEAGLSKLLKKAGFSFEMYHGVPNETAWKVHRRKHWLAHNAQFTGKMRNHVSPAIWDPLILRSGITIRPLNSNDFTFRQDPHPRAIDLLAMAQKTGSTNSAGLYSV